MQPSEYRTRTMTKSIEILGYIVLNRLSLNMVTNSKRLVYCVKYICGENTLFPDPCIGEGIIRYIHQLT